VVRHRSRGGTRCFIVATRVVKFISEGQFIERRGINYDAGVGQLIASYAPPSASMSTASMNILMTCSAIKFRNVNSRQCSKKAMAFV
jgi:hypothetical protein